RRNALPPHQVLASSTVSSRPLSTSSATSISQDTWLHTPSAVAEATAPNTIRITVPCSSTLVTGRWARTQRPKKGCSNCPTTNGSSNCSSTAWIPPSPLPAVAPISHSTSSGVRNMPATLDRVAAQLAPATLPRATETNATEDCTVEGSSVR